jgi:hypothetical protein
LINLETFERRVGTAGIGGRFLHGTVRCHKHPRRIFAPALNALRVGKVNDATKSCDHQQADHEQKW